MPRRVLEGCNPSREELGNSMPSIDALCVAGSFPTFWAKPLPRLGLRLRETSSALSTSVLALFVCPTRGAIQAVLPCFCCAFFRVDLIARAASEPAEAQSVREAYGFILAFDFA